MDAAGLAELAEAHPTLHVHPQTAQLRCLLTTISAKCTARADWIFYADRLNRLVTEFALNYLPIRPVTVTTAVDDARLAGVAFAGSIVGVSIIRAGEALEAALRSCCRNVRIGKMLIQRDEETAEAKLLFAKLPPDIAHRHVLVLDPMVATGGSALLAIGKLLEAGVSEERIVFVNIVATPEGIRRVLGKHPQMAFCTTSVAEGLNAQSYIRRSVGDYGDRYFSE